MGRSVPASDLYSLGLTAVYLLTAKNPLDLQIDPKSGNFQIPAVIASLDSNLAAIITRAISSNLGDRYSSAQEMLDDLSNKNFQHHDNRTVFEQNDSINSIQSHNNDNFGQKTDKNRKNQLNWWIISIYVLGGFYIIGTSIIVWYDWNFRQHTPVQLLEPSTSLPTKLLEPTRPNVEQPSMLNNQSKNLIEIPILLQELRKSS